MSRIWPLPHVGTLTGTMRIPIDKTNGGTANDTAHFTPDDVVTYVEANADVGGTLSDAIPQPAGIASAGVSTEASRADHVHEGADGTKIQDPTSGFGVFATEDGVLVTGATIDDTAAHALGIDADDKLVRISRAEPALSDATPAALGTAAPGVATAYSRGDHVHQAPTPASIGAATTGELATVSTTASNAATAASNAQTTANNALPKPGGTTTANGIAYGTGTAGAAVAISTTTIADLVKRLGNVFTLSANTVLDDSYSGGVIFVDTSGGARSLTIPTTVSAGWNAVIVREGANTLNIIGDGTMLMAGPAAAANAVAIAVDDGGVSVIRRSATKCWCAGVIA